MVEFKNVMGDKEQALPLIIGKDTVYVHTNIKRKTIEGFPDSDIYEYDEIQYGKDEYIKLMAEENMELNKRLLSTQTALCEIYENITN